MSDNRHTLREEFRGHYTYLTDVAGLGRHVRNWRAMLRVGLDAMDSTESLEAIEARLRTGRPLASPDWISAMEQRIQRTLAPAKRGPKPKQSLV